MKDAARELGISKERVRQIEKQAMNKLRQTALAENIQAPAAA